MRLESGRFWSRSCATLWSRFQHPLYSIVVLVAELTSARVATHGSAGMVTWLNALQAFLSAVDALIGERVAFENAGVTAWQTASALLIATAVDEVPVRGIYENLVGA